MTEKISIVNAGDYQLFPGDSHDSMMVEDEFQPDGGERPPKPKRKRVSAPAAKKIRTELDSEVMDKQHHRGMSIRTTSINLSLLLYKVLTRSYCYVISYDN